ncbi:A24 family peptidase [Lacipirellula limnantheis]|uniref:Leader peptidase PppA n=1 Tax=Lacipirellula limnantheis TaxID=2528024 RepID=A0A517TWK8_9BACT|nr:prepilin peptidase [Lacipirellula limnantheis]QDT72756.1 Leader peptidase PppA [Lacipirellula limnantheis]
MLDFVTALWLGFIGACIGSFLNVVAYRIPLGLSVVWKPSHCPKCGHNIRPRDNMPVLGWLLLRGRCRDCGAPISPRYAIVEAAMGTAFFVLAYVELFSGAANLPAALADPAGALDSVVFPNWELIILYAYHATLLSLLMAAGLIDQDSQRVPRNFLFLAGAVVCGALASESWFLYPERTRNILINQWKAPCDAAFGASWGALAWLLPLAALRRRSSDSMKRFLRNAAIASAIAGGFLGLRPIVRIFALWLVGILANRGLKAVSKSRLSPLLILWGVTLLHLACWRPLARLLSW